MVRPREWDREELRIALLDYIERTPIPIAAEFAYTNGLHRQQLYEMEELSDALKQCITKKEAALESQALNGSVNCTMAIFSLKQLGWKDTHEQTHKGDASAPLVFSTIDGKL